MKQLRDFQNRTVRLTDERLRHVLDHPEMAGMEAAIELTLRSPTVVVRSPDEASIALIYKFYSRTVVGDKWLCVVVKYSDTDAFIVTAYLTDRIRPGEQIWPKT